MVTSSRLLSAAPAPILSVTRASLSISLNNTELFARFQNKFHIREDCSGPQSWANNLPALRGKADVTLSPAICHTGGPTSAGSGLVGGSRSGPRRIPPGGPLVCRLSPPLQRQQQPAPHILLVSEPQSSFCDGR